MDNNPILEKLRAIAIRFQIAPKKSVGHAAKLDSIIKVLTDIKKAYQNFLKIELLKNQEFRRLAKNNDSLVNLLIKDLELIAVDIDFGSFEIALAPDIIQKNVLLFSDFAMELKTKSYYAFKDLIEGDFRDYNYITNIGKRYTEEERKQIYQPILSLTNEDFKVNIKDNEGKIVKTITRPGKEKERFYLPKLSTETPESVKKTVLAYIDVNPEGEEIKLVKKNIRKIHYIEELQHDIYPFAPIEIAHENFLVEFHQQLRCDVSFEDNIYTIRNAPLDITSTGKTREEAEDAFRANIYRLYNDYFFQEDKNLSEEGKKMKEELFRITKKHS